MSISEEVGTGRTQGDVRRPASESVPGLSSFFPDFEAQRVPSEGTSRTGDGRFQCCSGDLLTQMLTEPTTTAHAGCPAWRVDRLVDEGGA